jgi:hypothetical protein
VRSDKSIPEGIATELRAPSYRRLDVARAQNALEELGVRDEFTLEFFETYRGPFWSETLYFALLDPCEGAQTISSMTQRLQARAGLPPSAIVLTALSAGEQVVVLDCEKDTLHVIDVDRGHRPTIRGALPPRWPSFRDFLEEYFLGRE